MTSKDRMRQTMEFREPDRVPLHMNATRWVLEKLHLALGTGTAKELMQAMHLDGYDMRGLDTKNGTMPRYAGPPQDLIDATWKGDMLRIWGIREREMPGPAGYSYAIESFPLSVATDPEQIRDHAWPSVDWFAFDGLRDALNEWRDFSIIASGCSVFQHATFLRGMDVLLVDMLSDPDTAVYILDRYLEFYHDFFERIFESAADMIDVFALADDVATQSHLLISPELFETFVAPGLKRMAGLAHRYGCKLLLHSCGNVSELIPRFIALGVDVLDPIQPEADGMDPVRLKKEYGRELCFRGGISAQQVLAGGSVQHVRDETRRIIDIMAPGGGYILSPGHPVLQDDIPVENIIAMYETAFEHGRY